MTSGPGTEERKAVDIFELDQEEAREWFDFCQGQITTLSDRYDTSGTFKRLQITLQTKCQDFRSCRRM